MSSTGYSPIIKGSGGTGAAADVIVDTDDENPRPGDTRNVWAMLIDSERRPVAQAGVEIEFALYKNHTYIVTGSSGDGATLSSETATTDALGVATVTISYSSSATADDVFQVYCYLV